MLSRGMFCFVILVPRSHCVKMEQWFELHGHICMVFERYGMNLFELLRKNDYTGFPLDFVQSFAKQLLEAVNCALPFVFATIHQ